MAPSKGSYEDDWKLEFELNRFTRYYRDPPSEKDRFERRPDSDVEAELYEYTHRDAIDFAAKSRSWMKKNEDQPLPREEEDSYRRLPTSRSQEGTRAYYRVLLEKENKYILIACHANVHGFHRGDLRFVEVNDKTRVLGFEECSVVGMLYPGDVVAVTKLAMKSKFSLAPPPKVSKIHSDTECFWEVRNMTVLTRRDDQEVNFAILENGTAIVEGRGEAMCVIEDEVNAPLEMEKMYSGYAFIPEKMQMNFTADFHRKYENPLIALFGSLHSYADSLGTIYEYGQNENQTRLFEIGTKAFDSETFLSRATEGDDIVEKCVRMGASAAETITKGRFDGRGFEMLDIFRERNIIRFSIANPEIQPTESRWSSNTRIVLQGNLGVINSIIETVVLDDTKQCIKIASRLPRNFPMDKEFKNIWIVHQQPNPEMPKLEVGFMKRMHDTSNGNKVIRTLYGGAPIEISSAGTINARFLFPSNPPRELNEYQNKYVSMILADVPMVLGNSPFGCGKSMTIVTAAIEVHKRNSRFNNHGKQKQQLLVTQSNNAGVSLIEHALNVDQSKVQIKFLRYISETNYNVVPDSSRTELDMPKLMGEIFIPWATGADDSRRRFDSLLPLMKEAIVRKVIQQYIWPEQLVGEAKRIYENLSEFHRREPPSPRVLREAFFIMYQPDVIVSTADSLRGLIQSNALKSICNLQIDEASQLPEHTLIFLLQHFQHAGFGLVGDIKQLPPHCEEELKGRLKDYGVGNTMERAIQGCMFPQSNLRLVYRCHPATTKLLSDLFYDGKLISGVEEDDRSEFMRMRQDIWPNVHFPIVVPNQEEKGYRMGTSVANEAEKYHVMRIIECLTRRIGEYQLNESDIGVISFYRAQTSLLTEAFRGTGVKCGTVDAFQGTEREVIIVCCTNNKLSDFMKLGNRLNVAMSRARQATIIVGNVAGSRSAGYWDTIIEKARENNCLINDISKFGGDYDYKTVYDSEYQSKEEADIDSKCEDTEPMSKLRTSNQRKRNRRQIAHNRAIGELEDQCHESKGEGVDSKNGAIEPNAKPRTATQRRRERRQRAQKRAMGELSNLFHKSLNQSATSVAAEITEPQNLPLGERLKPEPPKFDNGQQSTERLHYSMMENTHKRQSCDSPPAQIQNRRPNQRQRRQQQNQNQEKQIRIIVGDEGSRIVTDCHKVNKGWNCAQNEIQPQTTASLHDQMNNLCVSTPEPQKQNHAMNLDVEEELAPGKRRRRRA